MASQAEILTTIQAAIVDSINAAGIQTPGQVIIGWPTGPQGAAIWGSGQWLISLFPGKATPVTRYRPQPRLLQPITPAPLNAVVTQGSTFTSITLSGTNTAGLNINTVAGLNSSPQGAYYQTTGAENFALLYSTIAGQINSFHAAGVSATSTGSSVRVTGPYPVFCNIGQPIAAANTDAGPNYPILVAEVARFRRPIQVTVWAADADKANAANDGTRDNLEEALWLALGGSDQPWNFAPDGSPFEAIWLGLGDWNDKAEGDYTVFKSVNVLTIEYGLLRPYAGAPIGQIQLNETITNQAGFTLAQTSTVIGGET